MPILLRCIIAYRHYKEIEGVVFKTDIKEKTIETDYITIDTFMDILKTLLDKHTSRVSFEETVPRL